MKKLYFLLLFFTSIIQAQIVNIPDVNFKNFLTHIIQPEIDINHDGEIQVSEAATVTIIYFHSNLWEIENIHDVTGIEHFINLTTFDCPGNLLTHLDVTSLTHLQHLNCSDNQLTSLNVSGLTELTLLAFGRNQITSIDTSSLTALEQISCDSNLLTSLTIQNQAMRAIFCENNNLTALNITGLPNLVEVTCSNNDLVSLNLTGSDHLLQIICNDNAITSLDLSAQSMLQYLNCNNNNLGSLNINGANELLDINCSVNSLTSLDLSGHSVLRDLSCSYNPIPSLDLSDLSALTALECSHTQITDLDLSSTPNLEMLRCTHNHMTTLDLSTNEHLGLLKCNDNLFTSVDLSNTQVSNLYIGNNPNLIDINIKNGMYGPGVFAANCPNLIHICADEQSIFYLNNNPDLADVEINSYCSFVPGGNFNTISGIMKFDADNNGCDANDVVHFPNLKVTIDDGTMQGTAFSDASGQYSFYTQAGNFVLTPAMENPDWFAFSPSTATIPFADNNNNTATQNFCIVPNGFHPDIEVVVLPLTSARPGFNAAYQITYKNKGNYAYTEGIVGFQFDDSVLDYLGANQVPMSQTTGQLHWHFSNLNPFESRSIILNLRVNSPMDTPAVNIGDTFDFTASSFPSEVDETPLDNTFTYHQTIVGSFDPNDKTCLEGDVISAEQIGKYLHYNINFENTGTAAAENIVVNDVIDTSKFDMSSLQILDAPSATSIRVTSNKLEVIFENIQLEPAAHGHVLFKIKTKPDLPIGTSVSNQASIYFDYNFPIQTNTATSTFQLLGNENFQETSVAVYPNPTSAEVFVTARHLIQSIQIFDAQGRIMQTSFVNDTKINLEIANYSKGIYFLRVATEKGFQIEKIVKE